MHWLKDVREVNATSTAERSSQLMKAAARESSRHTVMTELNRQTENRPAFFFVPAGSLTTNSIYGNNAASATIQQAMESTRFSTLSSSLSRRVMNTKPDLTKIDKSDFLPDSLRNPPPAAAPRRRKSHQHLSAKSKKQNLPRRKSIVTATVENPPVIKPLMERFESVDFIPRRLLSLEPSRPGSLSNMYAHLSVDDQLSESESTEDEDTRIMDETQDEIQVDDTSVGDIDFVAAKDNVHMETQTPTWTSSTGIMASSTVKSEKEFATVVLPEIISEKEADPGPPVVKRNSDRLNLSVDESKFLAKVEMPHGLTLSKTQEKIITRNSSNGSDLSSTMPMDQETELDSMVTLDQSSASERRKMIDTVPDLDEKPALSYSEYNVSNDGNCTEMEVTMTDASTVLSTMGGEETRTIYFGNVAAALDQAPNRAIFKVDPKALQSESHSNEAAFQSTEFPRQNSQDESIQDMLDERINPRIR